MNDSPFDIERVLKLFLPARADPLAVAVSGGPDSMALCHALSKCARGPVYALTVDHGLRPEAADEAQQVAAIIKDWPQVRHKILSRSLQELPEARIQERAREDRYALLAGYCAEHGIRKLFTAHHQDDQAETFLFRLAKGSGLDGLGAIRPVHDYSDKVEIIRPLLTVPKSALVNYCEAHNISYVRDPSNEDHHFARGRLRNAYEILAKEGLTPKRLALTADRLARAREALDSLSEKAFESALVSGEANRIVFNFDSLSDAPAEIRLRVISQALARVGKESRYGPRLEKIEDLAARIFGQETFGKATLGGCLISLDREKARLVIERERNGAS